MGQMILPRMGDLGLDGEPSLPVQGDQKVDFVFVPVPQTPERGTPFLAVLENIAEPQEMARDAVAGLRFKIVKAKMKGIAQVTPANMIAQK
jgi:hypothetical protein